MKKQTIYGSCFRNLNTVFQMSFCKKNTKLLEIRLNKIGRIRFYLYIYFSLRSLAFLAATTRVK